MSCERSAEHTVVAAWNNARNHIEVSCLDFCCILTEAFNTRVSQSMSRKGNFWDNTEEFNHLHSTLMSNCMTALNNISRGYNTSKIHSSLDYNTPLEIEITIRNQNKKRVARNLYQILLLFQLLGQLSAVADKLLGL